MALKELDRLATAEEIERVKLTECVKRGGHSWQIYVDNEENPTHVECLWCKTKYEVERGR